MSTNSSNSSALLSQALRAPTNGGRGGAIFLRGIFSKERERNVQVTFLSRGKMVCPKVVEGAAYHVNVVRGKGEDAHVVGYVKWVTAPTLREIRMLAKSGVFLPGDCLVVLSSVGNQCKSAYWLKYPYPLPEAEESPEVSSVASEEATTD